MRRPSKPLPLFDYRGLLRTAKMKAVGCVPDAPSWLRTARTKTSGAMLTIFVLCFSASAIAVDGVQWTQKNNTPAYAPGEVLVKFKPEAAATLQEQIAQKRTAVECVPDAPLSPRVTVGCVPDAPLSPRVTVRDVPDAPLLPRVTVGCVPDAPLCLTVTETLDRLNAAYRVREVTPVFPSFMETQERIHAIQLKQAVGCVPDAPSWATEFEDSPKPTGTTPLTSPLAKGGKSGVRESTEKDRALSETERRLLKRSRRAPPGAPIPALDRIFKLKLAPGVPVEAAVDDFARDPNVEFAEPNYIFTVDVFPNDPYFNDQWALHNVGQPYVVPGDDTATGTPDSDIDAPEAWDIYVPGEDVIVAIVDTGVDYNHPDMAANMWTDDSGHYGYDFANDDDDPMDDFGHGTICAGIVAAVLNNGVGISGVCPNAKIMAVKFLDDYGSGSADSAAQAICYAVDHGADVISNSYGYYLRSETLQAAADYAHSQGVVMAASAGNNANTVPEYPARYDHVISVAATDSNDAGAWFSTYGSGIDISAPGVDILSLHAYWTNMYGDGDHFVGGRYYLASGTSMSAPHVAAAAAMIISSNSGLSNDAVVARLVGTSDDIVVQNPSMSHLLGSGRLNIAKALSDPDHPAIVYRNHEFFEDDNGNGVLEPGEVAFLTVTLGNLWLDARNVQATLDSPSPYVAVFSANSYYGTIPSGQEATNADAPFAVSLSSHAPLGTQVDFTIRATTVDGYARLVGFSTMRPITLQAGDWPKFIGRYVEPIPYDVDGDGLVELVVTYGGNPQPIDIFKPDGSRAASLEGPGRTGGIAAGDLERDGSVEIVAVGDGWYLCVWNKDGEFVAPPLFMDHHIGPPTLYDIDADGALEILVQGLFEVGTRMTIGSVGLHGNRLEKEWEVTVDVGERPYGAPRICVGDIDGGSSGQDRRPELVFAVRHHLVALRADGSMVKGWPVETSVDIGEVPILADVTGDGNLEIIINDYDAEGAQGLQVWDHTGRLLWTGSGRGRDPVVADLDGDGDLEVLTQTKAYHHDGTDTGWSYSVINPHGVSVADIDADGSMEVLIGAANTDGLAGFRYDGTPLPEFPLYVDPWNKQILMTPVLADLDGDGDLEVTSTGTYFTVWDLPGRYDAANIEWGMFRHDPYRTGCYNNEINLPPVWFTAPEDQIFVRFVVNELYVQATDPERKSVTYEVLNLPDGARYEPDGAGGRLSWRPGSADVSHDVTFCAIDEDGERVEKTIHITLVEPSADLDDDGDTDLEDFYIFWECFRGPGQEPPYGDCDLADLDRDDDVDLDDFAAFQTAFAD